VITNKFELIEYTQYLVHAVIYIRSKHFEGQATKSLNFFRPKIKAQARPITIFQCETNYCFGSIRPVPYQPKMSIRQDSFCSGLVVFILLSYPQDRMYSIAPKKQIS